MLNLIVILIDRVKQMASWMLVGLCYLLSRLLPFIDDLCCGILHRALWIFFINVMARKYQESIKRCRFYCFTFMRAA